MLKLLPITGSLFALMASAALAQAVTGSSVLSGPATAMLTPAQQDIVAADLTPGQASQISLTSAQASAIAAGRTTTTMPTSNTTITSEYDSSGNLLGYQENKVYAGGEENTEDFFDANHNYIGQIAVYSGGAVTNSPVLFTDAGNETVSGSYPDGVAVSISPPVVDGAFTLGTPSTDGQAGANLIMSADGNQSDLVGYYPNEQTITSTTDGRVTQVMTTNATVTLGGPSFGTTITPGNTTTTETYAYSGDGGYSVASSVNGGPATTVEYNANGIAITAPTLPAGTDTASDMITPHRAAGGSLCQICAF